MNEIRALHKLGVEGCNVPAIMDVDFDNYTLTMSFIPGYTIREKLAQKGALLRDRDIQKKDPEFKKLSTEEKWTRSAHRGIQFLYDVVDSRFIDEVFDQVTKGHASRFILNDLKYGNIIEKKTGLPYLLNFEASNYYPRLGNNGFRLLRDNDIEKFNMYFAREEMTYRKMKEKLKSYKNYAPVYFEAGLRMGHIWNVDVGYGRWNFLLKHHLPQPVGKRILDLGTNNGFIPLQLLRHGAKEVIGVELGSENILQGNLVKQGLEWADCTHYNFKYIQADIKEVPEMNLGRFDMVLALCSLYYLDNHSISKIVQYVRTISNIFILQCNLETNIGRKNPRVYQRASVEFAVKVLINNGFGVTEIIAPHGYSRPLVIGRKEP